MDTLEKLLGGASRVKLLRLFLFNPEIILTAEEIGKRSKVTPASTKKELKFLEQITFLRSGTESGSGKKTWKLNPKFTLTRPLKYLLDSDFKERRGELSERFKTAGQIKLLIIAGTLIGEPEGRADLVLVGDNLRRSLVENAIKALEAEVGRELVYALLDTRDFHYRLAASDKFIRDLLEFPHEKIINKLDF